jgi:rod shape determining protein RodA
MKRFIEVVLKIDWVLFVITTILVVIGLLLIYSTTTTEEARWSEIFIRQLIAFGIGSISIFLLSFVDYSIFKKYAYVLYAVLILLLLGVLFFGVELRGTKGWFDLGFAFFQPSELGKVVLLIILSRYFASVSGKPSRFQFVVISGVITLIPFGLVMLQPDLGSGLVYIAIWLGLLLFSGIKKMYIAILSVGGVSASVLAWFFVLKQYQKARISSFIDPTADPLGSGYNLLQSKIAVGSGGFFGRGLGQGSQSQLRFLPERHTDFIFAVLTEELGFIGGVLLLGLFFTMFSRIIRIGRHSRDEFGIMFTIGATIMFVFQIFVNIGMNLGIMPITGIPLALVSYGGSSLVTILLVFGIVQSISVRGRSDRDRYINEF